jgi:uncharacterized repeat protein (TIGR01451 family)
MRFGAAFVAGCALSIAFTPTASAKIHLTDIRGREVVINRGPAPRPSVSAKSRVRTNATVTVNSGPDIDAAHNDFRRIQNAINAAGNGDTIILNGTFDFTQPFAAAAWALGNDNTAGTADDYSVYVPANLNNVTLTAASLGSATIQGPGDLAAFDLEGVFVFDGGPNQGWTISNLRILDFDLSIGFFFGEGGVNAFNNTKIQNNFIRIPTDLNATVAPVDVLQNIGIHYSFGTNQTISGNTIQMTGDGVSNGENFSSQVGMQCNTSGGSVYDGLNISNNTIHVLNAQSANPQRLLGIWENAHGHTSNITVSNNSLINDAPGNNPSLNLQRAFRVTSHSSPTSTVRYDGNQIHGANIGFEWISGSNFTGNLPIVLSNNVIANSDTGVLVQSNGLAHLDTDVITGSGSGGGVHVVTGRLAAFGANPNGAFQNFVTGGSADGIVIDATAGAIDPIAQNDLSGNTGFGVSNSAALVAATVNWWGNNLAAPVAAKVSGNVTFDPWLASGTDVNAAVGFQPFIFATTSGTVTTFAGTVGADTGSLLGGDPITMIMNGQTATTPLAQFITMHIQPGGGDDVFTLGQNGIPTVTFDGGAGNDTLVGTNVAQTWNITGAGSGNIPGATSAFSNVESLRGGTSADNFIFGAAGSIAGTLDGNLGVDALDNSAIPGHVIHVTGPGTLDGFRGTATGVGATFDNINTFANVPAELSVTKSGPASAIAGSVISYTITVTNSGPNPAISATLTDAIPAGTTFSSLTPAPGWSCTNSAGTITCTEASVPLGASMFTLNVNAPASGSVSNTATVTAASTDPTPGNNSSTATTTIIAIADVSITKTAAAGPYGTGNPLTYTIAVSNSGPGSAANVVVTDVLPAGTTFVSATPSQGSCSGTSTVTCSLGTIANGGSATIALTVTLPLTTGPVSNTATVTTSSSDTNPANNASTSTFAVVSAARIPAASPIILMLLALALGVIGFFMRR